MDWIKQENEMIRTSPLFRSLIVTDKSIPETRINGELKILAASNNYLGLATDARVIAKAQEAIERFGTGSGGSRLTTGNLPIHVQLEQELAHFHQTDSCLLYSSGYLANLGVISTLSDEKTIVFSDELNHASIIDACRLSKAKVVVYRHKDMNDLQNKLAAYTTHAKKIIVTDGVFSMDGDLAPLDQLSFLAKRHDALLIIDDAHATGVIGKSGRGSADYYQEHVDVTIGTLSKAVGSEGGFVCANKDIISLLTQKSRPFIFQTALAPASVAAALMSIDIIQTEPERQAHLMDIGSTLREALITLGFSVSKGITPIIPIIIGEAKQARNVQQSLHRNGVFIPAIRPPTVPKHTSRLRCTLMATHTVDHLSSIINAFKKIK
ncbi:MAG TPA: 8-amino-7-oxononanoate synthase [Virgibacillus sp.]|nr:8-amino-7-oxononanoate synthase [Virgibacillus sp.]